MRFDAEGIDYHESYRRGPVTHFQWEEIRAVALLDAPIEGRQALCVYTFRELPQPDIAVSELFTGSGPGLAVHLDRYPARQSPCIGATTATMTECRRSTRLIVPESWSAGATCALRPTTTSAATRLAGRESHRHRVRPRPAPGLLPPRVVCRAVAGVPIQVVMEPRTEVSQTVKPIVEALPETVQTAQVPIRPGESERAGSRLLPPRTVWLLPDQGSLVEMTNMAVSCTGDAPRTMASVSRRREDEVHVYQRADIEELLRAELAR